MLSGIIALSLNAEAQLVKPFSKRFQTTQKGGIVYLANVAVSCNANPNTAGGSCQTATNEVPPGGTGINNNFNGKYVDIDGDPSTFMSSSDSLNLANCSQITWAGLYWGAMGNASNTNNRNKAKIKVNSGSYISLTADESYLNTTGYQSYHSFKEITNIVKTAGIKARFTVADIPFINDNSSNKWGSWMIVVVYGNQLEGMKQLTVFDGLASISGSTVLNVPISGFLTPPTGPVNFEIGNYTHDGDRSFTGDQMQFKGAASFLNITDGLNPTSDVMNSTVSHKGVLTPFRKPNLNNTLGLDADIFEPNNATKNFIGNSATSATLKFTTGGETYLVQEISTAIDVYEPDLRLEKRVTDRFGNNMHNGTVNPGDTLIYTINVKNIGSDPSVNTSVMDSLSKNANYIPNSIKIIHGPNSGNKTDALSDDQVDYDAVNSKIKIRIGTGANSTQGGVVNNSPAGTDSTVIQFKVTATADCFFLSCTNLIANTAYVTGTGQVSGNSNTTGSNPMGTDVSGCPLAGSTNTFVNVGILTCATPPDTTIATLCPFTQTLASLYTRPGYTTFLNSAFTPVVTAASAGTYYALRTAYSGCIDTVVITVSGTHCVPPAVINDTIITPVNVPKSGNINTNNYFPAGFVVNVNPTTPIKAPSNGGITINASGAFTYTPNLNFTGKDTAVFRICGTPPVPGPDICFNDTLFITVVPKPSIINDTAYTNTDTPVSGNINTNNNDPAGFPLSVDPTPVKDPSNGTIIFDTTGVYTYTPAPGFTGIDTVVVSVCNGYLPKTCQNDTLFIIVSPPSVGGGGGGGVESKSLGDVIGKRTYNNAYTGVSLSTNYTKAKPFVEERSNISINSTGIQLADLMPMRLTTKGYTAYRVTPTDLIGLTNAKEVIAFDYTVDNINKAVSFATKTSGEVYNHTKQICERLRGAQILKLEQVTYNGVKMIRYALLQENKSLEYAVSFSAGVKDGRNSILLQNNWMNKDFTNDETMFNFQLWAGSTALLEELVTDVLAKLNAKMPVLQTANNAKLPGIYVSSGKRIGANLLLQVVNNNSAAVNGYFDLTEKKNELSAPSTRKINFTAAVGKSTISIPVNDAYEAGIDLIVNNKQEDILYLADGPWGITYGNNTTVRKFEVFNDDKRSFNNEEYPLLRNISLNAISKDYVSVYKLLRGGAVAENIASFKSLQFKGSGNGILKITLVKEAITNWANQYSYSMSLNDQVKDYAINLDEFKAQGNTDKLTANDIVQVVFTIESGTGSSNVSLELKDVAFSKIKQDALAEATERKINIYPNPSNGKFNIGFNANAVTSATLRITEVGTGRVYSSKVFNTVTGNNILPVEIQKTSGQKIYILTIETATGIKYKPSKILVDKK